MRLDGANVEIVAIDGELAILIRPGQGLREAIAELQLVRRTHKAVRIEGDPLRLFLPAETIIEPGARIGARALFDRYRSWASAAGVDPINIRAFKAAMEARGFERVRSNGVRWCDLRLKPDWRAGDG